MIRGCRAADESRVKAGGCVHTHVHVECWLTREACAVRGAFVVTILSSPGGGSGKKSTVNGRSSLPVRKNMFFLKKLKFNLTWTLDRKAKGPGKPRWQMSPLASVLKPCI